MLTDDEVKSVVEDLVKKMTDNDEMFTAFDVTHLVRVISDERIPHGTVKGVVNGIFADDKLPADYIRTATKIDVFGNSTSVFVYHPRWKDVTTYDAKHFQDMNSDPFDKKGAPKAACGNGRDKRGRLCVPVKKMREICAKPGKIVFVKIDVPDGRITVSDANAVPALAADWRPYKVDRSGNIRICKSLVDQITLSAPVRFDTMPGMKIEIS